MPDASIKDMAMRTVTIAEKIILDNGGKRKGNNYQVNTRALYASPLEFTKMPLPAVEVNKMVDYTFTVPGAGGPVSWKLEKGELPSGLNFSNGRLSGTASASGVFPLTISVSRNKQTISGTVQLVVRPQNLASQAIRILSNVSEVNAAVRDSMWLGFGKSAYANSVEVIRDGRTNGDKSVFYSIAGKSKMPKIDFYGYEWEHVQNIGMIGFNIGSIEENGGWFTSLNVQYLDTAGRWQNARDIRITPEMSDRSDVYIQPHFIEYLIRIEPVSTKAVRIIGDAAIVDHWNKYSNAVSAFTSITELSVFPPFDGVERIAATY
jgi:hypothetical protein